MKHWKWSVFLLAGLLLTGCGAKESVGTETVKPMTIRPTVFSEETQRVLDILDDEVMFFTYATDETVQSMALDIWFYEDGEWNNAGAVKGGQESVTQDIVLRIKDTEIDVIQVHEYGQSKYTYPVTQVFSSGEMAVEDRLMTTETIVPGEEIVLYSKVATDDNVIRSGENFRDMDCTAGMALTVVFSEEPVEGGI